MEIKERAFEIFEKIEELERRIEKLEEKIKTFEPDKLNQIDKKKSVTEFLQEINPTSDVKRTVVFGYYIEKYEDKDKFSTSDIVSKFREAKQSPPGNPSDTILKCIQSGWIMEAEGKTEKGGKFYTLTNSGIKAVENKFQEVQK